VLERKLANVGFDRAALARYPIFASEFLDFVKRVVPPDRHDALVYAVDVTATAAT
jgi:hypothetical protein